MPGAIPPLPNTPSLGCAQLKHRDNFTFYVCVCYLSQFGLITLTLIIYIFNQLILW